MIRLAMGLESSAQIPGTEPETFLEFVEREHTDLLSGTCQVAGRGKEASRESSLWRGDQGRPVLGRESAEIEGVY
jgi:hypothetical protein